MRRFFFRPSPASGGNADPAPPASGSQKKDGKIPGSTDIVLDSSRPHGDLAFDPREQYLESKESSNPHLRRSLSFSSAAMRYGVEEENPNFSGDLVSSPSDCPNAPHYASECPIHSRVSPTPERCARSREDLTMVQRSQEDHEFDSTGSKDFPCSSEHSSCSSHIPLRCRPSQLGNFPSKNKVLDLYIDGEQEAIRHNENMRNYFGTLKDEEGCLARNNAPYSSRKPPRAQSSEPSSPASLRESLRTFSFREAKETSLQLNLKLAHEFAGKCMKSQDSESNTTTSVEDIYMDPSDAQQLFDTNGHPKLCASEFISSYGRKNDQSSDELQGFPGRLRDRLPSSGYEEHDTDEKLLRKAKEAEERCMLLYEENAELERLRDKGLSVPTLFQIIQNIAADRKCLALELSTQIKSRLSDRFAAKEQHKQSKVELDTRTRRLEKEKSELQSSLEKELDRRSNDWSLKLGRFQSEEQRLRERVRELAEQNVSLQREVSLLKSNESEGGSKIADLEMQCKDLSSALDEMREEDQGLRRSLSELQDRCKGAEEGLELVRRNCKEKEEEIKGLNKVVVRLQRICNEQEKTIAGLRQGFEGELSRKSVEGGEKEVLRLTGVEQALRREIESCRNEIKLLRGENISLLERLKAGRNGHTFASIRLDREICERVDCLQTRGLSLLENFSRFSMELLESIKCKKHDEYMQDDDVGLEGYALIEYTLKNQNLRRGIENLRSSLLAASMVLDEKSILETSQPLLQTAEEHSFPKKGKDQHSEIEMELELKAESMLNKVLREKLCSQELELEQLQAELASTIQCRDLLQNEIQRFQDELSCLTHKAKGLDVEMLKKDESISQLQDDLKESMKELSALRSTLKTVKEERDFMCQESKQLRKTNTLMNNDLKLLRKKIEALDEDVLLKEGQISILKDGLEKKPLGIICSPTSLKDFSP